MKIFYIWAFKIDGGNSAGASRIMNFARALALAENQIYLCSLLTPKNITLDSAKEIEKNIYIIGEESLVKRFKLLYKIIRPIRTFFYVLNIYKVLDKKDKEIRIIFYPSIYVSLDLWVVIFLIKLSSFKVYLEVNEVRKYYIDSRYLPKNYLKHFLIKSNLFTKFIKYSLAERLTKYFSGLICISTNIKEYFDRYNINSVRIPILISDNKPSANSFKKYKPQDTFLICFSGSIMLKKEGFDKFFKALSNLKNYYENFELHLYGTIGKGENNIILESLPIKLNIKENIKYYGEKNQEELASILKEKHLLVLPRPFTMQNHYGFSTKLTDYLMTGVPILITDVSDNGLYIKDGVNGFIINPNDILAMTDKILYIINNYNKMAEIIGKNGYETASKYFHYSNYSAKLKEFLQ